VTTRPILRWHGGKWRLASWIIAHMPAHTTYVEPFGGAASVLLRKSRSYAEIYNDLDGDVVNVFRMARERGDELCRALELTPFAREEFDESLDPSDDPLERARRTIVHSFMGFGAVRGSTGFRAGTRRAGTTPARDWLGYPAALAMITTRLQGVVIEQLDALEVMMRHDGDETVHYVDPPYVHSTRSNGNRLCAKHKYAHELTDADHEQLAAVLHSLRGGGNPQRLSLRSLRPALRRLATIGARYVRRRRAAAARSSLAVARLNATRTSARMPTRGCR
jgi:DNA adenine methylase